MKFLKVQSVDEVLSVIKKNFNPIDRLEKVQLVDGMFRILAEDIFSPEVLPPFSRSSVDGYALKGEETYGTSESLPTFFDYEGEVKMGVKAEKIWSGATRYIPTGAMLPEGADAVVMVEYTEKVGEQVLIYKPVYPGENIIKAGDDLEKGQLIFTKGTELKEAELGVLSAIGIEEVMVYQRPLVGILSTGNELVPVGERKLRMGQVRDINSVTLAGIAKKHGADVIMGGIVSDNLSEIAEKANKILEKVDVLLVSGGSSVGKRDFTAQVVNSIGEGELLVEGISIKPGKPTIISRKGDKAILGLPGHPVSALMIFNFFGKELLNILQGKTRIDFPKTCRAILNRNIAGSAGRTDWVRIKINFSSTGLKAEPVFGKSGLITTLAKSSGYIEIPPSKEGLVAGAEVEVILWD